MLRIFRGTAFEFRHRYLIHFVIFTAGFAVQWQSIWPEPHGLRTWLVLSSWISVQGWLSFTASTITVTALGLFFVVTGAWLRTWGTAYLGAGIMSDAVMHGDGVLADGPYRHVRNPLYLGTWLHTLTLSLLMEPAGSVFTVIGIGLLQLRLIGGEESFLSAKLGEPYAEYCKRVPRLLPSPWARVAAAGRRPDWGGALLAESYFLCVAVGYGIFAWRFNSLLLTQCVVGAVGVSFITRAFIKRPAK